MTYSASEGLALIEWYRSFRRLQDQPSRDVTVQEAATVALAVDEADDPALMEDRAAQPKVRETLREMALRVLST
ncbi:MAG: hypothetical protein ER33_06845 [Cyanobium sp. CACIAM 14]|nr:MAG: hypothetical protein ER33_06845 [Cyanobium sp. CACIAM 14]